MQRILACGVVAVLAATASITATAARAGGEPGNGQAVGSEERSYGATMTLEHGVRVIRPVPEKDRLYYDRPANYFVEQPYDSSVYSYFRSSNGEGNGGSAIYNYSNGGGGGSGYGGNAYAEGGAGGNSRAYGGNANAYSNASSKAFSNSVSNAVARNKSIQNMDVRLRNNNVNKNSNHNHLSNQNNNKASFNGGKIRIDNGGIVVNRRPGSHGSHSGGYKR